MAVSFKNMCLFAMVLTTFACMAEYTSAQESLLPVKSPCLQAIDLALDDPDVRDLFLERIQSNVMVLSDITCLHFPGPENFHYIHFDFDCAPGIYCLLDPGLLVVVDTRRNLVRVVDEWYSPTQDSLDTMLRMLDVTEATDNR